MRYILIGLSVLSVIGGFSTLAYEPFRTTNMYIVFIISGLVSAVVFYAIVQILDRLDILISLAHNNKK